MDLLERLIWLGLGMALGFILGLIVANLRELKEEVDEIDTIVKEARRARDERGFMRYPVIADIALIVVLAIVVLGAFSAQRASNQTDANQQEIAKVTACNQEFLAGTIEALNQRTTYTQQQAQLNVELQRSQAEFLGILLEDPPPTDDRVKASLRTYYMSLSQFVDINIKSQLKAAHNPYPTTVDFERCLKETDNE